VLLEKENVDEVQRRWKNEFETPTPVCVTVARLRDKFGADGTVRNVDKEHSINLAGHLAVEALKLCCWSSQERCRT
jgi:hypothetical protein